jgi:hypothetical protein
MVRERSDVMTNGPVCRESLSCTQLRSVALLKVGVAALAITAVSAILPIIQIAGLDPAVVFRGKMK